MRLFIGTEFTGKLKNLPIIILKYFPNMYYIYTRKDMVQSWHNPKVLGT